MHRGILIGHTSAESEATKPICLNAGSGAVASIVPGNYANHAGLGFRRGKHWSISLMQRDA
ncbi:MAG: hypothetical protein Aurels2KO_38380 [Aureliella sp.]